MPFNVRQIDPHDKWSQAAKMDALRQSVPIESVQAVLEETGKTTLRTRKLSLEIIVFVVIAMHLYAHVSLGHVLRKLLWGVRSLLPEPLPCWPRDSALTYRRYQLGARPLARLFRRVCQPLAQPDTPGAFLFGLRLMALDGHVEDVPDTPENARAFGRPGSDRGESAYPQVLLLCLCECGTHAIIDAGLWPCRTSEHHGARRLLRSVGPGMLLMGDRGLYSYALLAAAVARGAQVLVRVPANIRFQKVRRLPDGSWLARLKAPAHAAPPLPAFLLGRVIDYTITDPALPGYGERHRLFTTLLEEQAAPGHALACAYHQRWEIEVAFDEMQTHLHLPQHPLRSRKPVGVIQEIYGYLIAHWVVRRLIYEAARKAQVDPDRISFTHALRVLGDTLPFLEIAAPETRERLYQQMLVDIAQGQLPARRHRTNPRAVKRKMSNFALKRPEHRQPPQPSCPFQEALSLI